MQHIHPPIQHLAVPLDELALYPGNARQGDIGALTESLRLNGQYRPVVANKRTSHVLAGNHTVKAAAALGWNEIAVTWVDVDDEHAARIVLADNRANDLASYNDVLLLASLESLPDLDGTLYDDQDLDRLRKLTDIVGFGSAEADDIPETPEPAAVVTAPGDLWILGRHRLLCADGTAPADIDRACSGIGDPGIVYADPPYGVSIVKPDGTIGGASPFGGRGTNGGGGAVKNRLRRSVPASAYMPVTGDASPQVAGAGFAAAWSIFPDAGHVWWGANHYAGTAEIPDATCWLVWDKENGTTAFADCELAWTNHDGPARLLRHQWNGMLRATERETKRVHPTQKPVALADWAFTVIDRKAERTTVLDPFAGSGSTLIAAERTRRTAALLEIEPAYCDVICRRFQQATGVKPTLEKTGTETDFSR